MIKRLFKFLIVLAALLFGGSFLIKPQWQVEQSINILARPDKIFPYLNEVKKWKEWTAWSETMPDMTYRYEGPPSGVGAIQKWDDGKQPGMVKIVESLAPHTLTYDLEIEGWDPSKGSFKLAREGRGTKVTWRCWGEADNPVKKYMMLIFRPIMAKDFKRGLQNLKEHADGVRL